MPANCCVTLSVANGLYDEMLRDAQHDKLYLV
jgi:hypothetical protein